VPVVASPAGGEIGWESEGSGPDLVLLHGTLTDRSAWLPLLPYLTDRYRVHRVDRRGRGLSASAQVAPDIGPDVEDLRSVLSALSDGAAVCGWSHGAVVATAAAVAGVPMSKLVVYDPPLPAAEQPVPAGLRERCASLIEAGDVEGAITAFLVEAVDTPRPVIEFFRQSPAWAVALATAASAPTDLAAIEGYVYDAEHVRACRVPTLVMTGALSPSRLRSGSRRLAADLPAGRLCVLEGQHHFAFAVDPAGFASLLDGFLRPS
jgi:pimeloyl-ACP methyl ester carboxylesterase